MSRLSDANNSRPFIIGSINSLEISRYLMKKKKKISNNNNKKNGKLCVMNATL